MSSILESFGSMIGPDTIGSLAKALGADGSAVSSALGAAGPLLMGGLAKMSSSPGGADSLMKMLPDSGILGTLGSLFGSAVGGAGGGGMVASLLGPGTNAIGAALSKTLGFNVAPLLAMAAPAVMGIVSKMVKSQNLGASGLASVLQKENTDFATNPANAPAMALVSAATAAGSKAEALIASYGSDWAKVSAGPAAAMALVASADLSGPVGSIKEAKAAGEKLSDVAKGAEPSSLIAAAFGSGMTSEMITHLKAVAPRKETLLAAISSAVAAVAAKSPTEARAYKDALLAVAQATAEASKEGGFLGIGGTLVSKEEQAALDSIKAALA